MTWPMTLKFSNLGHDEVIGTDSYNDRGILPKRMRRLHPYAAGPFREDLGGYVVVSDMFRSAESSLWAIENRQGSQPPGWSGHNYGLSIDVEIRESMKRCGSSGKRDFDEWMARRGWYCHRRDHRMRFEGWHYNYLGPAPETGGLLLDTDKRTNAALQRLLLRFYAEHFQLTVLELQKAMASLRLYSGELDGDFGPLSKSACKAFQRTWALTVDGIPGRRTQRTMAYVTALGQSVV